MSHGLGPPSEANSGILTILPLHQPLYGCLSASLHTTLTPLIIFRVSLSSEMGFVCSANVCPLFKIFSPGQHKQGPGEKFLHKTIIVAFEVSEILALPYCWLIMFCNIFSLSQLTLFLPLLLWHSWLLALDPCIQLITIERIS